MLRFILGFFTFTLCLFPLSGAQPHALTQYTVAEELQQVISEGKKRECELENEFYREGLNQVGSQTIEITDPSDQRIGKVKTQRMAIKPGEDPVVVASYLYQDGETEVIDGKGSHTVYRFQNDRISEIETDCWKEQFSWMKEKPFIECYTLCDKSDRQIKSINYGYDDEGKLIQETATGDFSGDGVL